MVKIPAALIVGAVIEAAEGVSALGFGLYAGIEGAAGHAHDRSTAFAVAVLLIAAGAAMLVVARGLLQKMSWGRSPAVLTQLFGFFIAYNLIQSDQTAYGAILGLAAAIALVALLSPPVNRTLFGDRPSGQDG